MPALEIVFYALASLIALLAAAFSADDEWLPSVGCTGMLMISWTLNTAFWMLSSLEFWPVTTDGVFAMISLLIFAGTGLRWSLVLALLFIADVVLDALSLAGAIGYSGWAIAENAIYVAQLAIASYPGWRSIMATRRAQTDLLSNA